MATDGINEEQTQLKMSNELMEERKGERQTGASVKVQSVPK